jgi:hypothetical protein
VPPSPKVHAYVSVPPNGLSDDALENDTLSGEGPEVGVAVILATGPLNLMRLTWPAGKST